MAAPPVLSERRTIKVAVVDMQPITPAIGGGRLRLLGLYHNLGVGFETTYVGTYDWPGERRHELRLSDSLLEIDVPLSNEHFRCDARWRAFAEGATIIDAAFPLLGRLSSDFLDVARDVTRQADVVVFSHPWVFPLLGGDVDHGRQLLVYDAHNVESMLRRAAMANSPFGRQISRGVAATEAFLCRAADLVIGCSGEDVTSLSELYGISSKRTIVVPNGVFTKSISPPALEDRERARDSLGISGHAAIFLGSNYGPNAEAARFVARNLAVALPQVTFVVCGGVWDGIPVAGMVPSNVRITGRVSDEEKLACLHACDIAVNPMFSGSGTNIKMFDFMAAGLPVICTPVGARGICDTSRHGVVVCSHEEMVNVIDLLVGDRAALKRMGGDNRAWVADSFAWETLSPSLGATLRDRLEEHRARRPGANLPSWGGAEEGGSQPEAVHSVHVPRLAILSTFGIRCGIAEYTTYLSEGLRDQGVPPAILANRLEGHEDSVVKSSREFPNVPIERVWHYDNATWTGSSVDPDDVVRSLQRHQVDHLNVQYHSAFFREAMLSDLLKRVLEAGKTVSVSLHDSNHATSSFLKHLSNLPIAVFVHKREEQDRLRALGVRSAYYIAHGVRATGTGRLATERRLAIERRAEEMVIGTFGFLRPHKGLLELVEALPMIREVLPGVTLRAYTALYPAADSIEYLGRICDRIDQLGLSDAVELHHEFLPIEHAIAKLAAVDVIVLPYAPSEEGSSAAAAAALAAGRPMITTTAAIFDELCGIGYKAENNSPPVLAAAVVTVLSNSELRRYLERRSTRAAELRNWRRVAQRFLEIVSAASALRPQVETTS